MKLFEEANAYDTAEILGRLGVDVQRRRLPCPIHGGRNKSAEVYDDHMTCFSGCVDKGQGKRYSNVDLVMHLNSMEPKEAAQWITGRYDKDDTAKFVSYKPKPKPEPLPTVWLDSLADRCRDYLAKSKSSDASKARDWLESRGFLMADAAYGDIGMLPSHAVLSETENRTAGHLRGRLTIGLRTAAHNCAGMMGRQIPGVDSWMEHGKYVSSRNTANYTKSDHLYPANRAAKSDHVILCEGHLDALALHAAGQTNSLAIGGKALSPAQARQLAAVSPDYAILIMDDDGPGRMGAAHTKQLLEEHSIDTYCVVLGADPADHLADWLTDRPDITDELKPITHIREWRQHNVAASA